MQKTRIQMLLFLLAVVLVCGWILLEPVVEWRRSLPAAAQKTVAPVSHSPAVVTPLLQDSFTRWAERGAGLGERPASLAGTQVDGALQMDADGNLLVDLQLRRVFDYFLATIGEESLSQIRARIAFYLQQNLSSLAAAQAWDVFNRYLHYKNVLAMLPGHDGSYRGMRDSLLRQRDLRDSLLGPELATAFFAGDDQYADFALRHVDQLRNPDLTPAQRQQQTEQQLTELPDNLRAQVQATAVPLQVDRQVDALRERGASESEIWQLREQQLGVDAAERLAQLDRQRAEWQQRYDQYRRQLASIQSSAMADIDKTQAIARLRAEQFSAAELKRVDALDRIASDARTLD